MASRSEEFDTVEDRLHVVSAEFRVGKLNGYSEYEDAEKAVREYFEDLDYNVHKMRGGPSNTDSYLKKYFDFFEGMDIGEPGMPDFFVEKIYYEIDPGRDRRSKTIKNNSIKGDYRFVEVKRDNGALRMNQLKWIGKYPHLPIEVIIVE